MAIMLISFGCQKEAGEGGSSSITGKLYVNDFDNEGNLKESYYGPDEDVYIIYGSNSNTYDDHFKTSYDGSYRFEYLTKGHYSIFAYSKCDSCPSGLKAVLLELDITENKTNYELEDLVIRK